MVRAKIKVRFYVAVDGWYPFDNCKIKEVWDSITIGVPVSGFTEYRVSLLRSVSIFRISSDHVYTFICAELLLLSDTGQCPQEHFDYVCAVKLIIIKLCLLCQIMKRYVLHFLPSLCECIITLAEL
jgi:hypothetical protein